LSFQSLFSPVKLQNFKINLKLPPFQEARRYKTSIDVMGFLLSLERAIRQKKKNLTPGPSPKARGEAPFSYGEVAGMGFLRIDICRTFRRFETFGRLVVIELSGFIEFAPVLSWFP
jgi:hypothetical protein